MNENLIIPFYINLRKLLLGLLHLLNKASVISFSPVLRMLPLVLILLYCLPLRSGTIIRPTIGKQEFKGIRLSSFDRSGRPKIGLVLSGGGARGLAQIGVLRSFEKHGIPVDMIVGNSFGSVVGGLYASGYTITQIESIATNANWSDLLSFSEETKRTDLFVGQKLAQQDGYLVIRFDGLEPIIPSSISGGQRLSNFFSYLTLQALYQPSPSFDELKIPFRATATDLISGRRIILDKGSLSEAMRASVTVPLLYSPLVKDSMFMVDGGLTSNIPADVARLEGCEVVIVVNSTSSMRTSGQLGSPWEIADQIMTIMMQPVNQSQMKLADIVITPETGERIVSDFSDIQSLISAGERSADNTIVSIQELIRSRRQSSVQAAADTVQVDEIRFPGDGADPDIEHKLRDAATRQVLTVASIQSHVNEALATGKFADVYAELDQNSLSFYLQRHAILKDIVFHGNNKLSVEKISSQFAALKGEAIHYRGIQHSLENIITLYRENGFSLARIESVRIHPEEGLLRFVINEGVVARIYYEGNDRTRDYVIRREFPIEDGDVFAISNASKGIVNIKSTGLFEYVLLDVRYEENRPTLILKVKEKSSELLRFGVHADNEHNIVGTLSIRDANFRGAWEDIGVTGRYGFRDRLLLGEYTINRIFNSYLTFNLKAYAKARDIITYVNDLTTPPGSWERLEAGKYSEGKYGWSIAFGSHFEKYGDISAELRSETHKIAGITGTGFSPEQYHYVSMKFQSIVDTEDKFSFPTSGVFLQLSYESANKRLGSDVSFSKIGVVYESYLTLADRHTLRPKVTFGFADETLPSAEQFSLGGQQSFFGLREDDSRGRQLFVMNMEYRFWLPYKFIFETYIKFRYDLGTISLVPEELKLNTFRHGVGFELALDTPLGPVSAGAGKSFYFRRDLPDSPVSTGPFLFYFSLGSSL